MREHVLTGLDGANPLAFLAALGVLDVVGGGARLAWRDLDAWRPVVTCGSDPVDAVMADLATWADDPAIALEYGKTKDEAKADARRARDLKPPPGVYRDFLERLVAGASATERRAVDFAAAFATDVAVDNAGNTKPTALHFTAGNQEFLKMVRELAAGVTRDDIVEAVYGPWRYERPLPVLQWDATASRDYALRAADPAKEKKTGVPGADWLAFRGLRFIGVVPRGDRILTTGCSGEWKTGRFRWPLWSVPLERETAASLLRHPRLEEMTERERRARGIALVLRSGIRRTDQGGYGSFTPAAVI
jgi:hypothetical protein